MEWRARASLVHSLVFLFLRRQMAEAFTDAMENESKASVPVASRAGLSLCDWNGAFVSSLASRGMPETFLAWRSKLLLRP